MSLSTHTLPASIMCAESVLLVASLLSYIPQLRQFRQRGDALGVSLFYVFWSSLVANQNFILSFEHGTLLDKIQYAIVCAGHAAFFAFAIKLDTENKSRKTITWCYGIHFAIITTIALRMAFPGRPNGFVPNSPTLLCALIAMIWLPLSLLGTIWSFVCQIRVMMTTKTFDGLSRTTLILQAVIFPLIAVERLVYNRHDGLIYWAMFHYCVYALGQGVLALLQKRRRITLDQAETLPLSDEA